MRRGLEGNQAIAVKNTLLDDLPWEELEGPYVYERERETEPAALGRGLTLLSEQEDHLMNIYDSIAHRTGVHRDDVKKVLLCAGYSAAPEDLRGRASPEALLDALYRDVCRFDLEIIGLPVPERPTMLTPERFEYSVGHLEEELKEYSEAYSANDLAGCVDALIDLCYVALGRVLEMGVAPGAAFQEVHAANMRRVRGKSPKRAHLAGHDAVKPEGWTPPDYADLLRVGVADVRAVAAMPAVLVEVGKLRAEKGDDYNNVPGGRDAYFPFGHASYVHMLYTKVLRLVSLANKAQEGRPVKFESARDSVRDLINYATFYVEWMDTGSSRGRS